MRSSALAGFVSILLTACGPVRAGPAEVLVENNRPAPIIVQLQDGRAWEVPSDGWGPGGVVEPGTRGTIYTRDCVVIASVTFERNGGFIVNPDDVKPFSFTDINITTVEREPC